MIFKLGKISFRTCAEGSEMMFDESPSRRQVLGSETGTTVLVALPLECELFPESTTIHVRAHRQCSFLCFWQRLLLEPAGVRHKVPHQTGVHSSWVFAGRQRVPITGCIDHITEGQVIFSISNVELLCAEKL